MRQKSFIVCLLVLLYPSVGLFQQIPPLVAEQGYADMVLVNGKIVSMDDRSITPDTPGNIFQAMAIKGESIMALGSNAEMRRLAGPNTRLVDVGSRTVIPGLIQTHYHSYGGPLVPMVLSWVWSRIKFPVAISSQKFRLDRLFACLTRLFFDEYNRSQDQEERSSF